MSEALTFDDFAAFYREVHGYEPFAWMTRLAMDHLAHGDWPEVLDLPTGSGKTSVIDLAVFAMAVSPERAPRRVVLVVDRRVIVDQAARHAKKIRAALTTGTGTITRRVAQALQGMHDDEELLHVAVLRGAMPRDDAWARRPDVPCVVVSTVDQVGSRLLFRAYGASHRMAPVHAGLLGNDVLYLLDEVHLSVPFCETLETIARFHRRMPEGIPDRFAVVKMSATQRSNAQGSTFGLRLEDRKQSGVLDQRLRAKKLARLDAVKVGAKDLEPKKLESVASKCAAHGRELIKSGARVLAVVVNRVDTARLAAALLREGENAPDVLLLTGRMRPLDRDALLHDDMLERLTDRTKRTENTRPLVVVATQCIEAGADFDFDALVTECASLDALRQRFGRLDRRGVLETTHAVILARTDQVGDSAKADPVYGTSLRATWALLGERARKGGTVDFGYDGFVTPTPEELAAYIAPVLHAPIVLPAYVEAWAQTAPVPDPDPEVALFLHGPDRGVPEVRVVWRADVTEDALAQGDEESVAERLVAVPPGTLEMVALPLWAARRWFAQQGSAPFADVEAFAEPERERDEPATSRRVAVWDGERVSIVEGATVNPGSLVVVPASFGGIAAGNWDPNATEPVRDLGDLVQWRQRGRATLRLNGAVLDESFGEARLRCPAVGDDDSATVREAIDAWFEALDEGAGGDLREPVARLAMARDRKHLVFEDGSVVLIAQKRVAIRDGSEATTEGDAGSFLGREVSLKEHSGDVQNWCRKFARGVGLPQPLADDVALAGWFHDVGKADPRFQRWLRGGGGGGEEILAKSRDGGRDRRTSRRARELAGYPEGYRHEVLSLHMLLEHQAALRNAHDPELVMHLVASHHGWCRPFAPPVPEGAKTAVTLSHEGVTLDASTDHGLAAVSSGVSERFWQMVDRYGVWGLAWLEAILRLADHRASEAEQEVA